MGAFSALQGGTLVV